jgi:hypothetical protein
VVRLATKCHKLSWNLIGKGQRTPLTIKPLASSKHGAVLNMYRGYSICNKTSTRIHLGTSRNEILISCGPNSFTPYGGNERNGAGRMRKHRKPCSVLVILLTYVWFQSCRERALCQGGDISFGFPWRNTSRPSSRFHS